MLFTSYSFIAFVALLLILYYLMPPKYQWLGLLFASYLFYYFAGASYLFYIIATTASVYIVSQKIGNDLLEQSEWVKLHKETHTKEERKAYKVSRNRICRRWLIFALLFNFGILAVVKYTDFAIGNINKLLEFAGSPERLSFIVFIVPMGISFYTLQSIGYLIDVYRGTVEAEKKPSRMALFISFFPQLVQGPISRYGDLSQTLFDEHRFEYDRLRKGLSRILWGLFKKMVVADRVLVAISTITSDTNTYNGAWILIGMLLYTLQLYADFTGGIDITIGIAQCLGIKVSENFNCPYFSKSLKEYWRRWHITMCSWFRDYVFYPVSTSKPLQNFQRSSHCRKLFGDRLAIRLPVYVASFIVWFCTGLWHGASWNFVVWGLCNWAVLMISEELEPLYSKFHKTFSAGGRKPYQLLRIVRTFLLVCCLNLFDCYATLGETWSMFRSMFTASNWHILLDGSLLCIGLSGIDFIILAAGISLMLGTSLLQRTGSVREKIGQKHYIVRFLLWYGLFLAVLILGAYGVGYDSSQFIYSRF